MASVLPYASAASGNRPPSQRTPPSEFQATRSSGNFASTALRSRSASSIRPSSLATIARKNAVLPQPGRIFSARASDAVASARRPSCDLGAGAVQRPVRLVRSELGHARPGARRALQVALQEEADPVVVPAQPRLVGVAALRCPVSRFPSSGSPDRQPHRVARERRHRQRRVRDAERERGVVARELPVLHGRRERDVAAGVLRNANAVVHDARGARPDPVVVEGDVDVLGLAPVHVAAARGPRRKRHSRSAAGSTRPFPVQHAALEERLLARSRPRAIPRSRSSPRFRS